MFTFGCVDFGFFQPGPRQACLGLIWPATQKSLPTPVLDELMSGGKLLEIAATYVIIVFVYCMEFFMKKQATNLNRKIGEGGGGEQKIALNNY